MYGILLQQKQFNSQQRVNVHNCKFNQVSRKPTRILVTYVVELPFICGLIRQMWRFGSIYLPEIKVDFAQNFRPLFW